MKPHEIRALESREGRRRDDLRRNYNRRARPSGGGQKRARPNDYGDDGGEALHARLLSENRRLAGEVQRLTGEVQRLREESAMLGNRLNAFGQVLHDVVGYDAMQQVVGRATRHPLWHRKA